MTSEVKSGLMELRPESWTIEKPTFFSASRDVGVFARTPPTSAYRKATFCTWGYSSR
jgi:hypothetical protein